LIGIVVVLALTYYASRWYAGRVAPIAGGRHIKVIDRLIVGKAASILIIELQDAQYLVGVSEQGVHILKELDERIAAPESSRGAGLNLGNIDLREINFRELLGKYGRRKGNGP
jgi:flagellar biogenesis protein FliO